jgi:hypothetical protein
MKLLTPNEEKCGTKNLQAHRGGAVPLAGKSTPCLHEAAYVAFVFNPSL